MTLEELEQLCTDAEPSPDRALDSLADLDFDIAARKYMPLLLEIAKTATALDAAFPVSGGLPSLQFFQLAARLKGNLAMLEYVQNTPPV